MAYSVLCTILKPLLNLQRLVVRMLPDRPQGRDIFVETSMSHAHSLEICTRRLNLLNLFAQIRHPALLF
jgi:hypothetical protein